MSSDSSGEYSEAFDARAGNSTRPREVSTASWLWFVAVALVLFGVVFALPSEDILEQVLVDGAAQRGFPIEPALAAEMMGMVRTYITVGAVVGLIIWLFVVVKMREGWNWARMLLAVFGGLHVVGIVIQLIAGLIPGVTSMALSLMAVLWVVELAAIVMMFRPATAGYFYAR